MNVDIMRTKVQTAGNNDFYRDHVTYLAHRYCLIKPNAHHDGRQAQK